jgi:hypothetical protein
LRELPGVLVVRYFAFVGTVLAGLLLLANWCLPEPPQRSHDSQVVGKVNIRIMSERTWPEKIVMETSTPSNPPQSAEAAQEEQLVAAPSDEMPIEASVASRPSPVRGMKPGNPDQSTERARRRITRRGRLTRVASARRRSRLSSFARIEVCCRFEWTDARVSSKAAAHKHTARYGDWAD